MENIQSIKPVKCDSCQHVSVCMYKTALENTLNSIVSTEKLKDDAPFILTIECSHAHFNDEVVARKRPSFNEPTKYVPADTPVAKTIEARPTEPSENDTPKIVERRL